MAGDNESRGQIMYEVCYISGHTGRYSVTRVKAKDADQAVKKAFEMEGFATQNRLVSVRRL